MHPTIKELLALRDGEGAPEVGDHLAGCELCRREMEHLQDVAAALQQLPELRPQYNGWARVAAAVEQGRSRRRRRVMAAAAALIIAAAAVAALIPQLRSAPQPPAVAANADDPVSTVELQAASQQLEALLHSPTVRYRVLTPRQAALIVTLEDHIALVDAELARNALEQPQVQPVQLWLERVELLHTMVEVHRIDPSAAYAAAVNHTSSPKRR
jgi:hypothetical protein